MLSRMGFYAERDICEYGFIWWFCGFWVVFFGLGVIGRGFCDFEQDVRVFLQIYSSERL